MTTFWWVRHGPTHSKAFAGWRDIPADLSDKAALDRLADYLPQDAIVISSDLIRSIATADAIQRDRTRLPHDPGLREFNFGLWDGMVFSDVAAAYPDLSYAYWDDPGEAVPPEGESWNAAAARVNAAVDRLIADHAGRDIVAVAHFGVILTQLQRGLGCTAYEALSHTIDNLSATRIRLGSEVGPINHIP